MSFRVLQSAVSASLLLIIAGPVGGERWKQPGPLAGPPIINEATRGVGAGAGWLQTISAQIEREEYRASATPAGLQAPNRAHDLRTHFNFGRIEVVPRQPHASEAAWRFTWSTSRVGRGKQMRAIEPSAPERGAAGVRVRYTHPGLVEWYENGKDGLEQGFTVTARPAGNGSLRIEGLLGGGLRAELREDGVLDLLDVHGALVLRYAQLRAWDAGGRALASRLAIAGETVAIEVEDANTRYPITVDPLMTSPAWTAESNQADASFGFSVATAGDVNGDGYSDVIVGAPYYDDGDFDEGRALLYLGSATGLATTWAWLFDGQRLGVLCGAALGTAGDVNGDGYSDVIVGSYNYDNGQLAEGRAFVFHGSASGLATTPAWTAESNQADAYFGYAVATAGDVNGDGYSDVIVGAFGYDNGQTDEGRVFVYHGSASGLAASAAWTAESDQAVAQFGYSVGSAGDVNGDGYSDVMVGAPGYDNGQTDEGRAFVYHGTASGLLPAAGIWTAECDQAGAVLGVSVASAGDVNGDGYSDVIVGAYGYDNGQTDEGRAFVYLGSALGLAASAAWTAESDQDYANFGVSVATAGDVNGDGYADVIVGAHRFDNGEVDEGRASVYLGSAAGLATAPAWTAESDQASTFLGLSVATAGDVNGDGYSDVIVGAPYFDNGQADEGRAFVYHGSAAGLAFAPAWTAESDQGGAAFGFSVGAAGDVNGDGFSDVIVGAPYFDNGQANEGRAFVYHGSATGLATTAAWSAESDQAEVSFGASVATAGDVNGDGYSDVIVGAEFYSNGQTYEGRAFVYHGSAAGLTTAAAWTAESDQAFAGFGSSVGTAGDVNGDGYSDVIVGAETYNNGQAGDGRAYVYHGSAAGLTTAAAWTAESDQGGAYFGCSVGTAGDVNGDGFSDVIVGAFYYDNGQQDEGRAFVYHGSATGLATTAAWSAESDRAGAAFGFSVSTAGDVNGDGYSDVIVGAMNYTNGQPFEGRAFVYQGSAAGLASSADWSAESDQPIAYFGRSVGTAGDVNGDGFCDVIVGAMNYSNGQTNEGRAYVYQGSAAGLYISPSWTAESDQADAGFGRSVATAGDVNGDGFSDVIVGADAYSNGQTFEGRAFVYYGNDGDGLERIPRQARTDDTAPISLLGRSNGLSAFRLKALGRTPAGRGRVRLQREVKPFGTPFNGSALATGPLLDTGSPTSAGSAVALSELSTGLSPGTLYHWRERIVTDSPFFPRSPWLWLCGNASSEADLRTAPAITGVSEPSADAHLRLEANAPNPFEIATQLAYTLPQRGRVRLAIYDIAGHRVAVLADGMEEAGHRTRSWGGRDARGARLSAGVYFARLEFGGAVEARKIVLTP